MKRIALVLEDENAVAVLIRKVLENNGLEVILVKTVAAAAAALEEHLPHLLFLDVELAGPKTGLDWLAEVRQGPFSDIPTFVVSKSKKAEHVKRATALKIAGYFLKPISYPLLMEKVEKICKSGKFYKNYGATDLQMDSKLILKGQVKGISETGILMEGPIAQSAPANQISYDTDLFYLMQLRNPELRLVNSLADDQPRLLTYFQIQGWSEIEFKSMRHWVRKSKLEDVR